MSVWVYNGDKSELVEPNHLQNMLNAGWSVTKGGQESPEDDELESFRAKAKELGVRSWHRMSLETLRDKVDGRL